MQRFSINTPEVMQFRTLFLNHSIYYPVILNTARCRLANFPFPMHAHGTSFPNYGELRRRLSRMEWNPSPKPLQRFNRIVSANSANNDQRSASVPVPLLHWLWNDSTGISHVCSVRCEKQFHVLRVSFFFSFDRRPFWLARTKQKKPTPTPACGMMCFFFCSNRISALFQTRLFFRVNCLALRRCCLRCRNTLPWEPRRFEMAIVNFWFYFRLFVFAFVLVSSFPFGARSLSLEVVRFCGPFFVHFFATADAPLHSLS